VDVALDGRARAEERAHTGSAGTKRARLPHVAAGPPVPPASQRAAHYDDAIRAIDPLTHEGTAEVPGATRVAVEHEGATLETWIDDRRVIVAARHRGGAGDVPALLDALCRVVELQPIREAADHGAARLELLLRGRAGTRVVPGIVSPSNADPRIGACTASLRALLTAYAGSAGAVEKKNEFVPPLRADWAAATPAEREQRAREALVATMHDLYLATDAVELASIAGDTRVVVAFAHDVPLARRPLLLFEIERSLKRRLDDNVAVYVEEMADKNRIRRLVAKPSATGAP
jgi:hypothetical protein